MRTEIRGSDQAAEADRVTGSEPTSGGEDRPDVPWFETPFFAEDLAKAQMPAKERSQVEFFAENGYLVWRPDIPDFDELADTIAEKLRPEHERTGGRVQDAWRHEPAVRRLATHPSVLGVLRNLYRRRPVPFQTLNFRHGTQQRTHSDAVHFHSIPEGFMCAVWFALEDVDERNGPLHYYPGSHKLRVYEPYHLGISGGAGRERDAKYERYEDFIGSLGVAGGLSKQVVTMKRGEAIIWASNLLHGGEPIQEPGSTRISQVTHCYFEKCRYYTPLHSDPPLGRFSWREIVDITTGEPVPHVYNGSEVKLPLATRARYAAETRLRESAMGRTALERAKALLRNRG